MTPAQKVDWVKGLDAIQRFLKTPSFRGNPAADDVSKLLEAVGACRDLSNENEDLRMQAVGTRLQLMVDKASPAVPTDT